MPKKSSAPDESNLVLVEGIETQIFVVRGQKVMLDSDLAELYGVETRVLKQAVRRNPGRFPSDFMLVLSIDEATSLLASRSQSVTLKRGQNVKYAPYAFTEHGAVMLASILNSPIAIEASIQVVRAFVRLRSILAEHQELARRLEALEKDTKTNFKAVFDLIEKYLKAAPKEQRQMGFLAEKK
jgi:phage regulator Rha-like protein